MTPAKLFIPKKIKIGFVKRSDSFTKKLGYVIYYDEKGVLRKQNSWESWRDKSIEPVELENTPTKGYVLNRGVKRCSDWGHSGNTFVRMYDPRDFEFEINVGNLIGVMSHSDVLHNEIQQECVFAWKGTELVLLPTNSEQYDTSLIHTSKQDKKISTKDLIPGATYEKRKGEDQYIYIGFYPWYSFDTEYPDRYAYRNRIERQWLKGKRHIFTKVTKEHYDPPYETPSVNLFAECINEIPVENLADLVEGFHKTKNSSPIVGAYLDYDIEKYINVNDTYPSVSLNVPYAENKFVSIEKLQGGTRGPTRFGDDSSYRHNLYATQTTTFAFVGGEAAIETGYNAERPTQSSEYHRLHEEYKKDHGLNSNMDIPLALKIQWVKDLKCGVLMMSLANGNVTKYKD